jgi:hypothetical protein
MKDLILITAHCPTEEKRKILLDLVIGLQPIRKDFDIMVVSHTPVTFDVQERVDWAIFDKDNELLKEWVHQNQPWFSPKEGMVIQSIFFGSGNTYLTLHKQLITGYAMARTFGYEKIQCVEYDAFFCDFTEFYENSKALDTYDAILYTKKGGDGEINLQFGIGNFHAAKISSLPEKIFHFNREDILKEIESSDARTTEKRTEDLYKMNGNKVLFKDHELLMQNGNILRLIDFHKGEFEMQWAVPFYDPKSDTVDFVVWNEASDVPATVIVILNDSEFIVFKDRPKFSWEIRTLGRIENINTITILINNKVKNHIVLTSENRELFKETNRSYYA